ncbi:hypothetical protein JQX13_21555 [Archangium violaceum]|uniref:hypothetical protein n=1 Tax=Archangium violaceum TaxID=83451 RepID=UPI00193BD1F9|nr:hypothetical protein [Archangium violaceum]QRK12380.1 hypothetical protein JQX13_21555 [Archangium violaceum]
MTRWMWLALALTLGGVQLGCGGDGTGANEDADGDGVVNGEDCDSNSALRWKRVQAYDDADKDGYGSGELIWVCAGKDLPSTAAAQAGDCAPQDSKRWRTLEGPYYADTDQDGVGTGPLVTACVGTELTGYTQTPGGNDCDDSNPAVWAERMLFTDEDKDGFGGGEPVRRCVGATLPPGTFEAATDCEPRDASRFKQVSYRFRDADGDGATVPEEGTVCGGNGVLPTGYRLEPAAQTDCDDTRADRWQWLDLYPDVDRDTVGSEPVEQRCSGSYPEPGYVRTAGDCAPEDRYRSEMQSYSYRDADGDGAWVPSWGQVCSGSSLPSGYATWSSGPTDCDDTNAAARVAWNLFPDTDHDGVGAGSSVALCAGPTRPSGYSDKGTDCAPEDASLWQGLTYQYRDADGDSFTVAAGGSLCVGASLPAGYTNTSRGNDCDDSRADVYQGFQAYADADGDGVGAGSVESFCTDGALPTGYSLQGSDCAPDDALRWRNLAYAYVDADGDGRTASTTGEVCTGSTLPPPYASTASGNDCDDTNPALYLWRVLYPDNDGDGVGAPPRVVMCHNDGPVPPGYSIYGFDPDDSNPLVSDEAEDPELEAILLGE